MRMKLAGIVLGFVMGLAFAVPGASAKDARADQQFRCRADCNHDWSGCHERCMRRPADERDDCDDECTRDKQSCERACDRL